MASNDNTYSDAQSSATPTRFGLVIFPVYELLDIAGPIECLNVLSRLGDFDGSKISLSITAETMKPVSSGWKDSICAQSLAPTHIFDNPPDIEVLLVPGGFGAGPNLPSGDDAPAGVIEFIRTQFPKLKYLITVCTGAGLAARAGVLDGKCATTNKAAWKSMTALGKDTYWISHARWVASGGNKVWTTSGVSAGTDGFLAWIQAVYGPDYQEKTGKNLAEAVCTWMEYTRAFDPSNDPWAVVHKCQDVVPAQWGKTRSGT